MKFGVKNKNKDIVLISKPKGFTLVELVVVIAIIAVLMALAIVTINTVRRQSRNAQLRNDAQTAKVALEAYYTSKKTYPLPSDQYNTSSQYDRMVYTMFQDVSGVSNSGTLSQYITGDPPENPSNNGGTVCYNWWGTLSYRIWVITEETATKFNAGGDACAGYVNKCSCGISSIPKGDIYSQE